MFQLNAGFKFVSPQCINSLVQFTDTSKGEIFTAPIDTKWLWNFGDALNSTSAIQNPSFTYTTAGNFDVILRVALTQNGNEFCADSIKQQIVISPIITIANVISTPSIPRPICANTAITYTAVGNAATGSFKWFWDFGDGKKDTTTTNSVTHSYATASNYPITVYAKIDGGCKGNDFSFSQAVYKVTAIPTFVSPQCINTPVVFTDNSTGTVTSALIDTKWEWTLQGGSPASSTTQNTSSTFATAGTYNIKLKTSLVFGLTTEFCSHDSTK